MAYRVVFKTRTAIPTLQNTYNYGIFWDSGAGEGGGGWRGGAWGARWYAGAALADRGDRVVRYVGGQAATTQHI